MLDHGDTYLLLIDTRVNVSARIYGDGQYVQGEKEPDVFHASKIMKRSRYQ